MTEQTSIWRHDLHSMQFAELCNALYERELLLLVNAEPSAIAGRLKSLPYYIKATALAMTQIMTPLNLDVQNATWSSKQSSALPITEQKPEDIIAWYQKTKLSHGLVVPICLPTYLVLDSIVRLDTENNRFKTNVYGWFSLHEYKEQYDRNGVLFKLLKPNKKVMMAACAGHAWQNNHKIPPVIPSLRELRLSCDINWKNFKKTLVSV